MKTKRDYLNRKLNLTAICLLFISSFTFVGCNDDDDDDNNTAPVTVQNTQVMSDADFMVRTSHVNRAEIELGQLAQTRGSSDSIRAYGSMMVAEHSVAQNELATLAANKGMNLPTTLDSANNALKQQLSNLSGRQFDSLYIHSMVTGHQTTQDMFEAQISQGQDQEVINYAIKYLPHINMHLQKADSISRNYGNGTISTGNGTGNGTGTGVGTGTGTGTGTGVGTGTGPGSGTGVGTETTTTGHAMRK